MNRSLSRPSRDSYWLAASEVAFRGASLTVLLLAAARVAASELGLANVAMLTVTAAGLLVSAGWSTSVQRMSSLGVPASLSWTMAAASSAILSTLLWILSDSLAHIFNAPDAAPLIRLIAPLLFLQQLAEVALGIAASEGRLIQLARVRLVGTGAAFAVAAAILLSGEEAAAVVLFPVIAWAIFAPIAILLLSEKPALGLASKEQRRLWLVYTGPLLATNVITVITVNVDNFLVARLLGSEHLSRYVIAFALMSLPAYVVGHNLHRALLPRAIAAHTIGGLRDVTLQCSTMSIRAAGALLLLTLAAVAASSVVADWLLRESYEQVSLISAGLAGFTFARLVLSISGVGFLAVGRSRFLLGASAAQLIVILLLGIPLASAMGAVGVALTMSIAAIVPLTAVHRGAQRDIQRLVFDLKDSLAKSSRWLFVSMTTLVLAYLLDTDMPLWFLTSSVISGAGGLILLSKLNLEFTDEHR